MILTFKSRTSFFLRSISSSGKTRLAASTNVVLSSLYTSSCSSFDYNDSKQKSYSRQQISKRVFATSVVMFPTL